MNLFSLRYLPFRLRWRPRNKIMNGFNAAFTMNHVDSPGFQDRLGELTAATPNLVLRFPGGTIGNYYHVTGNGYGVVEAETTNAPDSVVEQVDIDATKPANYLAGMVSLAQSVNAKVVWVANLWTGTIAETLTALHAFDNAGVGIAGVELGNEWYLPRYQSAYPTHAEYITQAKAFRDAIKADFPGVPVAIIVVPSNEMKDLDSGNRNSIATTANNAIWALAWPDAYALHSYAPVKPAGTPYGSPEADAVCLAHRQALQDHVNTFSKPVWLTEWNVVGTSAGGTVTQTRHCSAMRELFKRMPQMTLQTMHSLTGAGIGYNAIRTTGGGSVLTPVGQDIVDGK